MIIPDKYTPPEKSLIYKSMQLYFDNPEIFNLRDNYKYNKSIFKDVDEYIKVLTLLYTLGIIKESEVSKIDPSN
ncbi:hypothetical protein FH508_0013110 [Lysinibacillus sp. CD3-6]|uniref:hypothetical protein n=1 Tax=Lysinibacillus sp. CD3-6 TaxID=2892541 RepID=UPI00116E5601|nr:hypothetical protein [Lysinibacillus sp. CD3-6]UED78405.1 hypothetical protein FH508_0013110 [Lysinibacillus sp. CD3-6]